MLQPLSVQAVKTVARLDACCCAAPSLWSTCPNLLHSCAATSKRTCHSPYVANLNLERACCTWTAPSALQSIILNPLTITKHLKTLGRLIELKCNENAFPIYSLIAYRVKGFIFLIDQIGYVRLNLSLQGTSRIEWMFHKVFETEMGARSLKLWGCLKCRPI